MATRIARRAGNRQPYGRPGAAATVAYAMRQGRTTQQGAAALRGMVTGNQGTAAQRRRVLVAATRAGVPMGQVTSARTGRVMNPTEAAMR